LAAVIEFFKRRLYCGQVIGVNYLGRSHGHCFFGFIAIQTTTGWRDVRTLLSAGIEAYDHVRGMFGKQPIQASSIARYAFSTPEPLGKECEPENRNNSGRANHGSPSRCIPKHPGHKQDGGSNNKCSAGQRRWGSRTILP
jgi:hypothetical protein